MISVSDPDSHVFARFGSARHRLRIRIRGVRGKKGLLIFFFIFKIIQRNWEVKLFWTFFRIIQNVKKTQKNSLKLSHEGIPFIIKARRSSMSRIDLVICRCPKLPCIKLQPVVPIFLTDLRKSTRKNNVIICQALRWSNKKS